MKTNKTCEAMLPLLSDYVGGELDGTRVWEVQAHLTQCRECSATVSDFHSLGNLLRQVPLKRVSDDFESCLFERLDKNDNWHPTRPSLAGRICAFVRRTAAICGMAFRVNPFRPMIAFATGVAAVGLTIFLQTTATTPTTQPDTLLVSHCVAQHRLAASAQPLSDWPAQNLDGQLDLLGSSSAGDSGDPL